MLKEAIDRIAGWGVPAQDARSVALELNAEEMREAALIHLATLLSADIAGEGGRQVHFDGFSVGLVPSGEPSADIRYEDVGAGFKVDGVVLTQHDGPTRLADLLCLFHFARDESDGLVHLPPEMRKRRIVDVANASGASERFVRHLLGHYHHLAAKAAA